MTNPETPQGNKRIQYLPFSRVTYYSTLSYLCMMVLDVMVFFLMPQITNAILFVDDANAVSLNLCTSVHIFLHLCMLTSFYCCRRYLQRGSI